MLIGYVAGNSVQIKTRDIDALTIIARCADRGRCGLRLRPELLDRRPGALRREARVRAMARGEAEATEYARNNGFSRVRLLSVEEGVSYRGTDIVVTGSRICTGECATAAAAAGSRLRRVADGGRRAGPDSRPGCS